MMKSWFSLSRWTMMDLIAGSHSTRTPWRRRVLVRDLLLLPEELLHTSDGPWHLVC